jgi:hypothetical protein
MRRFITLAPFALLGLGCGSLAFQGYTPSVRATQEEPGFNEYYVGANANFAVLADRERPRPAPAAGAARDPYDVWNTPVALPPPSSAYAPATETVSTGQDELYLGR